MVGMKKIRVIITASWEVMAKGVIEVTSVRFPGENRRSQAPDPRRTRWTPLSWVPGEFIYVCAAAGKFEILV